MVMGSSIQFIRQCETSSIEVDCILLKDVKSSIYLVDFSLHIDVISLDGDIRGKNRY